MSQDEVYKILKELGGKATTKQIKTMALEKFPTRSLYTYVFDRLKKLEKNGYITKRKLNNKFWWIIINEYP